jgi:sugar phosphate isomerase/epimerase
VEFAAMRIGLMTDSVPTLSLADTLELAVATGIEALEFATGNWSSSPHVDLPRLVEDEAARRAFSRLIEASGLSISALNCSGNPLQGGDTGRKHDQVTRDTIELAGALGIERVVLMSGCPPARGDHVPNWITVAWPPEVCEVLAWQWDEVLIPYWRELVRFANDHGVRKLCIELHGHQNVYNVRTFRKLRDAAGETIGVNFDPSHLIWMGADPLAAIRALGEAIYHVHAKDTRIETTLARVDGLLETGANELPQDRTWNFATLGYGHGEAWWAKFVAALAAVGYDDVLSIEHEDMMLRAVEGVRKSVSLLERVVIKRNARTPS